MTLLIVAFALIMMFIAGIGVGQQLTYRRIQRLANQHGEFKVRGKTPTP
jgi:hypothetical protein